MTQSKGKTVIVLGTGATMRFCDFKANEIFGVNGAYTMIRAMPPHLRKHFWMSKLFLADTLFSHETGTLNFDIDDVNKFAEEYHCEVYALNKMVLGKHIMNTKPIPFRKIKEYFGTEYFSDTVCYMLAYILLDNSYLAQNPNGVIRPELADNLTIRLFGIDMCTTREYSQSKGGVEHWLGIARGMGCQIFNGHSPVILQNAYGTPYGFWHKTHFTKKKYDPMGLLSGKKPTTSDYDKMAEKLEGIEQGNRDTDEQWAVDNPSG